MERIKSARGPDRRASLSRRASTGGSAKQSTGGRRKGYGRRLGTDRRQPLGYAGQPETATAAEVIQAARDYVTGGFRPVRRASLVRVVRAYDATRPEEGGPAVPGSRP